jgi:predicted DNA-binding transcriptional regulator AlpA
MERTNKKPFLSIPELASILGISRIAMYKRVKAGDVPCLKIGRIYAIPKAYLSEINGTSINKDRKADIKKAVKRVVDEYGELLIKLGNE